MNKRFIIALAAALAAAATCVVAAAAGTGVQITPTGKAAWPDRELVVALPSGQRVESSRFTVLENGKQVLGARVAPASALAGGVALVIDASDSMRGAPIRGAMYAARAFAARRNVNQRIALVTFNSSNRLALPFTGSQSKIDAALAQTPRLAFGTHIYDAIATAVAQIQAAGLQTGVIVILSDGGDTGSTLSLEQAANLANKAHIRVYSVGLRGATFRPGSLQGLAAATGGSFSEARNTAELAQIYDQLGLKLANQYVVTYKSLLDPGTKARVSVSVAGIGNAKTAYTAPAAKTERVTQPLQNRVWRSWVAFLVVALLVGGLIGMGLFLAVRPTGSTVRARLSDFVSTTRPAAQEEREPLASRVFEGTEQSLEKTRWWQSFTEGLELANIKIPPVQLLAGTLILTLLVMWVLGTFVAGILALLGLAVPFLVRAFVLNRIDRTRRAFAEQLPDNLDVVASGLRAGHSIVGGMSLVVNDAAEPSRSEFQRVIADEQLGIPLEDSLSTVARRMNSRDVEQVALVSSLQRQTGGNSAEVLDRVVENIRERQALRRLIRTLTAQGRMSRWIVSFLPVALLLLISAINPSYMKPLFTHTSGHVILVVGAVMIVAGSLVIKRIVDFKV
ncbi:MAG TPA: type II secretion system F family protein [Gaiellaceae bacterium]|nr:type II secretion system F family protein [Gaiellaceae bacterium]